MQQDRGRRLRVDFRGCESDTTDAVIEWRKCMPAPIEQSEERAQNPELNRLFFALWLTGSGTCLALGYFLYGIQDSVFVQTLLAYFLGAQPIISGKYLFFLQFGELSAVFFVSSAILFLPFLVICLFSLRSLKKKIDRTRSGALKFRSNEVSNSLIAIPLCVVIFSMNFLDLNLVTDEPQVKSTLGVVLFGTPIYPFISMFSFFIMASTLVGFYSMAEKVLSRKTGSEQG